MADATRVVKVVQGTEQLSEVVASEWLLKFTGLLHLIEQFTVFDVVHDDVEDFSGHLAILPVEEPSADGVNVNDELVLHLGDILDFLFKVN